MMETHDEIATEADEALGHLLDATQTERYDQATPGVAAQMLHRVAERECVSLDDRLQFDGRPGRLYR